MKKILFINSSPEKSGVTVTYAANLLEGLPYETITLADYRINTYGSILPGDQFDEILAKICECDILVLGSPMYWHNLSGGLRVLLDRFYGPVASGSLAGKDLYLIYQGGAPEKWMLEAGVYTIQRFAALYGLNYQGCISYRQDIAPLKARLHQSI